MQGFASLDGDVDTLREYWVYISKDHVGLLQYEILETFSVVQGDELSWSKEHMYIYLIRHGYQ